MIITAKRAAEICREWYVAFRNMGKGEEKCVLELLDVADTIEALEAAQPKWISVKERLPNVEVVAANFTPRTYGHNEYIIGYVYGEKCTEPDLHIGNCYAENDYEILHDVTHWMPIPNVPEGDNNA